MAGNLTAFDIGESTLKMVQLAHGKIRRTFCLDMPEQLVSEGVIRYPDAMAEFLRHAIRQAGFGRGRAAVLLPEALVAVRNVELPLMTQAQLRYNLPFEFREYLTQEKGQYYYAVRPRTATQPGQMEMLASAAEKQTISQYREIFRQAGCRLVSAMAEEVAYEALLACGESRQMDCCIVDVGHRGVRVFFYRAGVFAGCRRIAHGLEELEQKLCGEKGLDPHVAHTYLRANYRNVCQGAEAGAWMEKISAEIMKAVQFYLSQNRGRALAGVYLTGGGGGLDGLRTMLSRLTGLEMLPLSDCFPEGIPEEAPWCYARCAGCALEDIRFPKTEKIPGNLVQRESQKKNMATLAAGSLMIAVVCTCVAKFGVMDQLALLDQAERTYKEVHESYVKMEQTLSGYSQLEARYRMYSRAWLEEESDSYIVERFQVLDLVDQCLRPWGQVHSVSVRGQEMVVTMSGESLEEIGTMLEQVRSQSIVSQGELTLASAGKEETGQLEFTLRILLKKAEEEEP